jgi:hypothetical protein
MNFLSLSPFVPSGPNMEAAKQLFVELGFKIAWDMGDYAGFESGSCNFILQKFDNKEFAENFMLSVRIESAEAFWKEVNEKQLAQKYGVRFSPPCKVPYGIEVNLVDGAGVCWHFVE